MTAPEIVSAARSILTDAEGAALDAYLDALLAGRADREGRDRAELLAAYPRLAAALDGLDLVAGVSTGVDDSPHPTELPPMPERVGPYRVQNLLGAGGFGVVYLAYDPDLKMRVAVKVLHPGRLDQPQVVERFHREARATGRLHHPGIVRLCDYSRTGPPYYLVTEYVEGHEPRDWCRARGAGLKERAELVMRVAEVVEYAHTQKVTHRDLKPANILVDGEGAPHVLDFGLARLDPHKEVGAAGPGATVSLSRPTDDGHILGSLAYMAPEQAAGRSHEADARSDVYSLGVILYELLTGHLPHEGPLHSLPARVVEDAPRPPRALNPAIPRDLEAVCLKAMAKLPGDRYERATDLAADLRRWLDGVPVRAARPGMLSWVRHTLDRRHLETLRQGWTLLLVLLGVTIFLGCALANVWELLLGDRAGGAVLATKLVQVAVMLALAATLRPVPPGASRWAPLSAAERQIWNLVPAYYGAFLTLIVANRFLATPMPLAPVLAVMSGMGFASLGAAIWGWFYVWAAAFFALALLMGVCPDYGLTLLGLGWMVSLVVGGLHMRWGR